MELPWYFNMDLHMGLNLGMVKELRWGFQLNPMKYLNISSLMVEFMESEKKLHWYLHTYLL